jgi:ATP-binding cassette subfamily F protein 3
MKTIYETVDAIAEGEIRKDLRSVLGAFLFTGEDIDKRVGVLSGGERTRLALCQLLLSPSNVLILDEPTNHLDIQSKEVLKEALKNYEGTFIVVSHDREFLQDLTNRIWDIEDHTLKIHHFGVQEFLQRKMDISNGIDVLKPIEKKIEKITIDEKKPLTFDEAKELKRQKTQLNNQLKRCEDKIEDLEKKIALMTDEIANLDYSNEENAALKLQEFNAVKEELDTKMIEWEQFTEQLLLIEE